MNQIYTLMDKINNATHIEQLRYLLEETSNTISLCASAMLKNQNQVIDFIQEAKVGKLSNIFLNSQTFINAMRHIHLDQSDHIRFPFNLNRLNLRLLNSIISVEPIYTTNNLVVVVKNTPSNWEFRTIQTYQLTIEIRQRPILLG